MLRQHSDALTQATLSILKTETLTGQELKDIMAQHPPQDPPRSQVSWAPHKAVHYHVHPTLCTVFLSNGIVAVTDALFGLVASVSCAGRQEAATTCCLPGYSFFCSPNIYVCVVQNGSGPDGGSPDTPDNISGASEMATLSTPVLAGPVHRSADIDL